MDILLKKLNFYDKEENEIEKCLLDSFLKLPEIDMKDIIGMMVDILMASVDTVWYFY